MPTKKKTPLFGSIWGSDAGTNPFPLHRPYVRRDIEAETPREYHREYWCRVRSPNRPEPKRRNRGGVAIG